MTSVGFLALSETPVPTPTDAKVRRTSESSGSGAVSRTLAPPPGILKGELMVACVEAGGYGGGGDTYVMVPPSGWTAVHEDTDGHQIMTNMYVRTADQADEDQTSTYTWSFSMAGGQAGMHLVIVGWPRRFGRTIGNAAVDHSDVLASIPSPGGSWQLAFIAQRTASGFPQPEPSIAVTSTPANELLAPLGNARSGVVGVYASDNANPIIGEYLTGPGLDFPRQGLVVAAVTA